MFLWFSTIKTQAIALVRWSLEGRSKIPPALSFPSRLQFGIVPEMNTNNFTICFLLTLLLPLASTLNSNHLKPSSKNIPAMYVFGDSLHDSGNNNHLTLPAQGRANFFPYGIDFGGKSTGRFTNGKTVVDYIGKTLVSTSLFLVFNLLCSSQQ